MKTGSECPINACLTGNERGDVALKDHIHDEPAVLGAPKEPLTRQTYLNLPDYRTKSGEITLIRR
jgi:hypothetical protein